MTRRGGKDGFQQLGEIPLFKELQAKAKPPTRIQRRIMEAAAHATENPDTPREILYQHSALCQTFLPYRDPGDDARTWERLNGTVHMKVLAGEAMHPVQGQFVPVGLPFGAKARLVLMHINQLALRAKSPEIEVENTLTRFVSHTLGLGGIATVGEILNVATISNLIEVIVDVKHPCRLLSELTGQIKRVGLHRIGEGDGRSHHRGWVRGLNGASRQHDFIDQHPLEGVHGRATATFAALVVR